MPDVYSRDGDTVTLRMPIADWEALLMLMGAGTGSATANTPLFYGYLALVNRLNTGNPHFRPYEIPEEFRGTEKV